MARPIAPGGTVEEPTIALVRLAAVIATGSEAEVRSALDRCAAGRVPGRWVEELILQSYLFVGLPRALNAAREWRRSQEGSGAAQPGAGAGAGAGADAGAGERATASPGGNESYADIAAWRARGEETCAIVYGEMYGKLRQNIRALHPAFDEWMIVEGYGKVLGRDGLDLGRRELCIVAACAATGQDRQLHSHFHGAINAGVAPEAVDATLAAIAPDIPAQARADAARLWNRVRGH